MPLTVSWQPWADAPPAGSNILDLRGPNDTAPNWPAYLADFPTEWHPHLEAVRQSIVSHRIWAGGDWHQNSPNGMPVLSDAHYISGTWRDWGDLLAAVWNTELGEQFTYMDFYMDGRLPTKPAAWE